MKKTLRYQTEPTSPDSVRKWTLRLLYDYGKGRISNDDIQERFEHFMRQRDVKQHKRLKKRMAVVMRETVEGMKALSRVMER